MAAIDRFAATLREFPDRSAIWLIDEIGKMECLSTAFVEATRRVLDSGRPLIATVAQRGGGFIDEVKRLVDSGAKEVTLLGQTINHYFYEANGTYWSFADLLYQVHEQVPALSRLRFLTSYPRDFTDDALDVMKSC